MRIETGKEDREKRGVDTYSVVGRNSVDWDLDASVSFLHDAGGTGDVVARGRFQKVGVAVGSRGGGRLLRDFRGSEEDEENGIISSSPGSRIESDVTDQREDLLPDAGE